MTKITTMTMLPPEISMAFQENMLKIYEIDHLALLSDLQCYIEQYLVKKVRNQHKKMREIVKLRKEFEELYGKASTKKKNATSEKKNKTEGSLYCISLSSKSNQNILEGLKYRAYKLRSSLFKTNDI